MHMGQMRLSMVMAVLLEVEVKETVWEFRDHRVNDVHIINSNKYPLNLGPPGILFFEGSREQKNKNTFSVIQETKEAKDRREAKDRQDR